MRGLFVVIDGMDGAGKSVASRTLRGNRLLADREVIFTREPGGTELAEALREIVLHRPMDSLTELLLVFAARRDHVQQLIVPALKRGAIVVSDRFTDSTVAYQGFARGVDLDKIATLESWVQEGLQPDLTLWFDLDATEAARRRAGRREGDRFESEDIAFFNRVRAGYAARCDQTPHRYTRIDASKDEAAVERQVQQALVRFLSSQDASAVSIEP